MKDSDAATGEKQFSSEDEESQTSYITALVLVVPGVILYAYTLYIMLSKLVYPASFLPFTQQHAVFNESEAEDHALGEVGSNIRGSGRNLGGGCSYKILPKC